MDSHTRQAHIEIIQDPSKWPQWPLLPVKKDKDFSSLTPEDMGIILDGNLTTVIIANMYEPVSNWKTARKIEYQTVEELVDAGWIID